MEKKFLLRKIAGDQTIAAVEEARVLIQQGHCRVSDFLFDFGSGKWQRVGDHPELASLFAAKPAANPERKLIYFLPAAGLSLAPAGPFSTKEFQKLAVQRQICASTWVFVEGDKEWRQVRAVKLLLDTLPPLPAEAPPAPMPSPVAAPAAPPLPAAAEGELSSGLDFQALEPERPSPPPLAPPQRNPALDLDLSPPPPPAAPELSLGGENTPSLFTPKPPPPAFASLEMPDGPRAQTNPSITLDLNAGLDHGRPLGATAADPNRVAPPPDAAPDLEAHIEREEQTFALDTLALGLSDASANVPPPPRPSAPPPPVRKAAPLPSIPPAAAAAPERITASPPAREKKMDPESFDGLVAEIPMDPIWLVKQANSETVAGPFRFLEIVKYLEEGKLTKNDKVSRVGTKSFVRILQQYEFNVKYSLESVVENGVEKQKLLIRRRHPRVPYLTGVQVLSKHGLLVGSCINISGGGILVEIPRAEFNLGEIVEVRLMPGLIPKSISCKSLVIGKIPKIPPGFALKFEDLKNEDKEVIEHFVQESLNRELSKKN